MARILYRQDYGTVNAVADAVSTWKIYNSFTSQDLLLQGVERFDDLKASVARSVDAYVTQYDSTAEREMLPEFRGMDKETAIWDAVRYNQAVDMLKCQV